VPTETDLPFRLTIPCSVTTYMTSARVVVTMLPGVRSRTIRLVRTPWRSWSEDGQMNDLPPVEAYAPRTNCDCPPVPLMWRWPADSLAAWPCRSICVVLLIETTRSFCITSSGRLIRSAARQTKSGLRCAVSYSRPVPKPKVQATSPG
jgi:hypothetical protein